MSATPDDRSDASGRGAQIIATVGTLTGISALFVAARIYVRFRMMRHLGLDDYLILLSMVCGIANLGISSAAAKSGSGQHFDTLTTEQQQNVIKYTMAAFCPGILSFAIPKLAVVALLTKLLNPSRGHRIFLWASSATATAVLFGCVIILYAQCRPSHSQWNFAIKGECWSPWVLIDYAIFSGSLSAAVDLYLAVYPACVLLQLQMNIRKKIGLGVALGIGSVACIVAIYKCTRIPGLANPDFSYHTADLVVWTCVEGSTIIIAACIPILQPLAKVITGKSTFSSSDRKGGGYSDRNTPRKPTHHSDQGLSTELSNYGKSFTRTKIGVTQTSETGSQERILQAEEQPAHKVGRVDARRSLQAKIKRTDEVTVSSSPVNG
ncbi:hypothetical protein Q7P37_008291 [Cladosporium fusiforme]